jgi:PAS domain S-box-containing protein
MPTSVQPTDYQRLFYALPDSFLLLRPDGTVVDNSDAHVATSLLPRAQAVGKNIFAAYPSAPESQRELDESHEYVRQHRTPHTMALLRYDLARPDGSTEERYWQITHYPLFDAQGQLEYILQRPQDVTAQTLATHQANAAAQALADSQERSRFILESLPVMVWTNTPDGQPDYFNPRWLSFTGKTQQELIDSNWTEQTHPDDLAGLRQTWATAIASGKSIQYEYRLRRHDGQYRWVLIQAVPRRAPDGQLTMWVGSASDIHDQRQLVAELLQANEQQALLTEQAYQTYQKSESQRITYHKLFMEVPALVAIVRGPDHRYEFINPAYQQLFPHRELLNQPVATALPEVVEQGLLAVLDDVYTTGNDFHDPGLRVEVARTAGGPLQEVVVDITLQQFQEHGQPAGLFMLAVDVTALTHAQAELAALRAQGPATLG